MRLAVLATGIYVRGDGRSRAWRWALAVVATGIHVRGDGRSRAWRWALADVMTGIQKSVIIWKSSR
jgi:hypothetical protein